MHTLRHLVVGTDFSPVAEIALHHAITLARLGAAAITLVHVCEPSDDCGSDDEVLAACRARLEATAAAHASCGVAITPILRSGIPADKIHNVATEVGASLIIIGRGRGALGVVAERVLQTASRPVLAVACDPLTELP